MSFKKERYIIKIPHDTTVIYYKKKNILLIKGAITRKVIFLKLKIFIDKHKQYIRVSSINFTNISTKEQKKIKALRGTTISLIRQKLVETSVILHKKLSLKGVGYRIAEDLSLLKNNQLTFKLGYSHLLYFKLLKNLTLFCFNKTKICIFGNSYQNISQIAAKLKAKKKPDPYKGKGILYENERVILKEGKKV